MMEPAVLALKLTAQGEALPSKGFFGSQPHIRRKRITEISHVMTSIFVKLTIWMIITPLLLCISSPPGHGIIQQSPT